MLIRFIIENMFSFGERKEFNMIPNNRLQTLDEHKYNILNQDILKIAALYGANASGKSNFVNSLLLLKNFIIGSTNIRTLNNTRFKFNKEKNKKQTCVIEYICEGIPFIYALELDDNIICIEELYISGLDKKKDKLIYERKTNTNFKTEITFNKEFESQKKCKFIKDVLLEEFVAPDKPIFKLLSNRENKYFNDTKIAYKWFSDNLEIISPNSRPLALPDILDKKEDFKKYIEEIMCSFDTGICSLNTEKKLFSEYFTGEEEGKIEEILKRVEKSPQKMIWGKWHNNEILIKKEDNEYWVEMLKIGHNNINDKTVFFNLKEESDGTVRLLDFLPAFHEIINRQKVYIVDEIERSIHPLLIKELISKFSNDRNTHGQLIFTTHESNLLDQSIFRQDEIWFVEKDKLGNSDLYSLNDFKEHKTKDIRKGYLNGRYGAVPFLGNLKDLNWGNNDFR